MDAVASTRASRLGISVVRSRRHGWVIGLAGQGVPAARTSAGRASCRPSARSCGPRRSGARRQSSRRALCSMRSFCRPPARQRHPRHSRLDLAVAIDAEHLFGDIRRNRDILLAPVRGTPTWSVPSGANWAVKPSPWRIATTSASGISAPAIAARLPGGNATGRNAFFKSPAIVIRLVALGSAPASSTSFRIRPRASLTLTGGWVFSNRWADSERRSSRADVRRIREALKFALSSRTFVVDSSTSLFSPPITPARATGSRSFQISRSSGSILRSWPSSVVKVPSAPIVATRIARSRPPSKACVGWPSSSIT